MGPALDHREGRLGDNGGNRCSKLGGCYRLRRTTGRRSLGVASALLRSGSHLGPGAIMALPARFSLLHSDLNDFLFASVGEEQNGVTLSVVSGVDAARPGSLGRGCPAHPLAEGSCSRGARDTDCSIAHPSNAIIGRFGHQPAVGGAFAGTKTGAFAGSGAGRCGAEEILGGHDIARQPCPRRRNPLQHVVIGCGLRSGVICCAANPVLFQTGNKHEISRFRQS